MRTTTISAVLFLAAACGPARAGAPAESATPAPAATAAAVATDTPPPHSSPPPAVKGAIARHKDRMRWIEGPPSVPGSRMTILEGSPKEANAIYTMRLGLRAGTKIPPHQHPQDERVTVIDGSVSLVFGNKLDEKGEKFGAGDFYVVPAGVTHFLWTDEAATLQVTGIGPWEMKVVSP